MTGASGRGQTTLDYTVGVTIFLLVLSTVFLFIPGTLQPFMKGGQEDIVAVNRVADSLAEDLLGDPGTPYLLDRECTVEFFEGNNPGQCRHSGSSLTERVGVKDRQYVNVTLKGNVTGSDTDPTELLCWDGGNEELVEADDGACGDSNDVVLAEGPTPPQRSTGSAVTARRVVTVDGTDVSLIVKMW